MARLNAKKIIQSLGLFIPCVYFDYAGLRPALQITNGINVQRCKNLYVYIYIYIMNYLLFIFIISLFIVNSRGVLFSKSPFIHAGILGLILYFTYDVVNSQTIEGNETTVTLTLLYLQISKKQMR